MTSRALCEALGPRATLRLYADADHSFHVPARSGRRDADVRAEMMDALAAWIESVDGHCLREGFRRDRHAC